MRYRRNAPQAPRLLLRVVAGAGVAAVAVTTACSDSVEQVDGFIIANSDASFDAAPSVGVCDEGGCPGVVLAPDSGADASPVCCPGPAAYPPDAADSGGDVDATTGPCGGGVCGISIMPERDAGDSSTD
jgi:hypothetical protein